MKDWSGTDAEWEDYFSTLVSDIAANIWPKWEKGQGWVGDATNFFEEATRAELQIQIDQIIKAQYLTKIPEYTTSDANLPQRDHFWLYALEDDVAERLRTFEQSHGTRYTAATNTEVDLAKFGLASVAYYDHELLDGRPLAAYQTMFTDKYEGLYQTKLFFRRPRPQQAAFALQVEGFEHRQALWSVHTGNHPSLVSGHCVQGYLMMCTLVEQLFKSGATANELPLEAYRQFAADVGDRRVFAGVHYLTDNVAAWITVLRAIPWIFPSHRDFFLQFVGDAIRSHSAVYNIASQAFPPHQALDKAWQLLQAELSEIPAGPGV